MDTHFFFDQFQKLSQKEIGSEYTPILWIFNGVASSISQPRSPTKKTCQQLTCQITLSRLDQRTKRRVSKDNSHNCCSIGCCFNFAKHSIYLHF